MFLMVFYAAVILQHPLWLEKINHSAHREHRGTRRVTAGWIRFKNCLTDLTDVHRLIPCFAPLLVFDAPDFL
jgi:hypothetical protein